MSYFAYKTRGNAHPAGKQRIYFACHPEDFSRYFHEITEDIFESQNCVVYYADAEQNYTEDELTDFLSNMQLFVVPITNQLLTEETRTKTFEIPYALQHHIPILPLLQEDLPEEPFRDLFGDLQYLDKHIQDHTAISFSEKLQKYLDAVLVNDDTAKKVRAAFRSYIFLSYRKKDRTYAQNLMRMIHKHDFCRDIAIWYDEFLTPGENFNDEISNVLKKSELFTLVVTPNIVQEENYIMTVEYPVARQAGKAILPVEMVQTDRTALEAHYEGIPLCTQANEAALSGALTNSLSHTTLEKNHQEPQHNFLIGLAYLSGIDVEVDHDRAVELITGAAEQGCEAAVRKLISMYGNGNGVPRNRENEIAWTRRLIALYREEFKRNPDTGNLTKLHGSLLDLVSLLFYQADLSLALEAAESELEAYTREANYALEHFEETQCKEESDADASHTRIAKALLEQSIHVWKSEVQTVIGNILLAQQNYEQAESYFLQSNEPLLKMKYGSREGEDSYISVLKELAHTDLRHSCGVMIDIAQNYHFLGDLAVNREKFSDAVIYFEKQLNIMAECIHLYPYEQEAAFCLGSARINLAWARYQLNGNADEAEKMLTDAIGRFKSLYTQNQSDRALERLATSFQHLAEIHLQNNHPDRAYEFIHQAIEINQHLVYEQGLRIYARNLNKDEILRDRILRHRKKNDAQEPDISALAAQWNSCEDAHQKSQIEQRLQAIYKEHRKQITICLQTDQVEQAEALFERCLEIRRFFAQHLATPTECRRFGGEYSELAKFLTDNGHREAALEAYQTALDIYRKIYKTWNSEADLNAAKRICTVLGKAYLWRGEIKKAFQYLGFKVI